MSPHTVALVQNSWAKLTPIAPQAAELFYTNLFARDPALIPLFRGDMRVQGQKLMTMIGAAVNKLSAIDTLLPVLQGLGRRHSGYGVQPHHYDTVGSALLQTLEQGLGEGFTPQVCDAWSQVHGLIAGVMQQASKVAEPA